MPFELAEGIKSGRMSASDVPTDELSKFVASGSAASLRRMVTEAAGAGASAWAALFTGSLADASDAMIAFAGGVIAELRRASP